jgi:hypothetical protein
MHSELRVLKYLSFRLNISTPYEFMEILLEILGSNEPTLEPKIFYLIGVRIMEYFYYARDEIYSRLFEAVTGRTRDLSTDRYRQNLSLVVGYIVFYLIYMYQINSNI